MVKYICAGMVFPFSCYTKFMASYVSGAFFLGPFPKVNASFSSWTPPNNTIIMLHLLRQDKMLDATEDFLQERTIGRC